MRYRLAMIGIGDVRNAIARGLFKLPRPVLQRLAGPPVVIEVDFRRGVEADFAALVPGAERVGDRGVRYASDAAITAYRGFLAGVRLASIVD